MPASHYHIPKHSHMEIFFILFLYFSFKLQVEHYILLNLHVNGPFYHRVSFKKSKGDINNVYGGIKGVLGLLALGNTSFSVHLLTSGPSASYFIHARQELWYYSYHGVLQLASPCPH